MPIERKDKIDDALAVRMYTVTDGTYWVNMAATKEHGLALVTNYLDRMALFVGLGGAMSYLKKASAKYPNRNWRILEYVPRIVEPDETREEY